MKNDNFNIYDEDVLEEIAETMEPLTLKEKNRIFQKTMSKLNMEEMDMTTQKHNTQNEAIIIKKDNRKRNILPWIGAMAAVAALCFGIGRLSTRGNIPSLNQQETSESVNELTEATTEATEENQSTEEDSNTEIANEITSEGFEESTQDPEQNYYPHDELETEDTSETEAETTETIIAHEELSFDNASMILEQYNYLESVGSGAAFNVDMTKKKVYNGTDYYACDMDEAGLNKIFDAMSYITKDFASNRYEFFVNGVAWNREDDVLYTTLTGGRGCMYFYINKEDFAVEETASDNAYLYVEDQLNGKMKLNFHYEDDGWKFAGFDYAN